MGASTARQGAGVLPLLGRAATLAQKAFAELERWLSRRAAAMGDMPRIERETEQRGREMLRLLLQAHLDERGRGDVGRVLRVRSPEGPTVRYLHKRLHPRRLVTLFGTVVLTRMAYRHPGRPSIHPLDAELQLPARLYSYEVQRRLVKAAVQGPFDEALERLADATGVHVPKRSAEQVVSEASADFDAFYAARSCGDRDASGSILVAAIDSKGIPLVKPEGASRVARRRKGEKSQKKRMSTVAAVFTQLPDKRTPEEVVGRLFRDPDCLSLPRRQRRAQAKRIWASLLTAKPAFIADVRAEMIRRDPGPKRAKTWVIVTDGERGLQHCVCDAFPDVTLILDLLHVLEKLWAAAHALHAEGSPEAQAFVRDRALRILRGNVSQVVKGLRQMITKRRLPKATREPLRRAAGYFYRNRSRMHYDVYLARGWPIASGAVEGACKNLIKDRMERSGMRWTPPMAEAILRLRATYLSGDFDEYWEFHVRREQERLYPSQLWRMVAK